MCGIAGFRGEQRAGAEEMRRTLVAMAATLRHRGPDDEGTWTDALGGIGLAHRRLSVIDLSTRGHQPMVSRSGRLVITYNGEIYNFRPLRAELEGLGHAFLGTSDTEVLLAALEQWGVRGALERANGMFAFALWDRAQRTLSLARDRAGEKPLYYGWAGRALVFASELKALRAFPGFEGQVDRAALALFVRHGYIPAPHSIYQGVAKLPPGTFVSFGPEARPGALPEPFRYWSLAEVVRSGLAHPYEGSEEAAIEQLDRLLRDAVAMRMESDVPLGAFLSGGIDSSTIVALMQAQSARPIRTFSMGFTEEGYDEAGHARAVAQHLGTDHTEMYVTPRDALEVIPRLPRLYDEPFADMSQIPTFLVSALARRHVTVSLSGDAGDELFGGYTRYRLARRAWRSLRWAPALLRRGAMGAFTRLPERMRDGGLGALVLLSGGRIDRLRLARRATQLPPILAARDARTLYQQLMSYWREPAALVLGATDPPTAFTDGALPGDGSLVHEFMYVDGITYLPDDILVKVDRASMAVSLESRIPLLDPRVIEFAWRLPLSMKLRAGRDKWILRQVLYRYVPPALVERPKMGFGVPMETWLRGPLRDWAEALLEPDRLRREAFLEPRLVRARWQAHLAGHEDHQYAIWVILMFQAWLEEQRPAAGRAPIPLHELSA